MAQQCASVGAAVIGDGSRTVLPNHVRIEIHHALSRNRRRRCAHAVGGVANRTTKTVLGRMKAVLREAGIGENLRQVVALRAHGIRTGHAGVGSRKEIGDDAAGHRRLAELIIALKEV